MINYFDFIYFCEKIEVNFFLTRILIFFYFNYTVGCVKTKKN